MHAPRHPDAVSARPSPWLLVLICTAITLAIITAESYVALAIVLMEGLPALAVLAAATLAGLWIVRLLGLAAPPPLNEGGMGGVSKRADLSKSGNGGRARHEDGATQTQDATSAKGTRASRQPLPLSPSPALPLFIFASAFGIGLLSLLTLALGLAGWLNRATSFALVAAFAVSGLIRVALDIRSWFTARRPAPREPADWLWLLVPAFLAITLLAAALPPGILWREEGFAYDVLEYHLAVPKTFFEQGRITFLAGNVYSNFPLNSEMLSLLMMELRGHPIEAAFMATIANVGLAALFVAAAWLAGRTFGRRPALIAAVLAAGTPWLAYLAGIAYVEPGMLAMGMAALAALLHATRDPGRAARWIFAAGLLAGLACGFKYTALPLLALPLLAFALIAVRPSRSASPRPRVPASRLPLPPSPPLPLSPSPAPPLSFSTAILFFALGTALTFSPWLARNYVNTRNPVFPLAYSVFGAKAGAWQPELDARWHRAHDSAAAERGAASMPRRAIARTILDPRMGVLLFALAAAGALRRRDRITLALLVMLATQVAVWLFATHLFARFAVVLLIPLLPLASRLVEDVPVSRDAGPVSAVAHKRSRTIFLIACAAIVCAVALNLYHLGSLYYDHTRIAGQPLSAFGRTDLFVEGKWPGMQHLSAINALGPEAKVMLVGEARTFYVLPPRQYATVFNRLPLADAVQRDPSPSAILAWLREQGTTHLLVNWGEMSRLSRTYGFYPGIDVALFLRLTSAGLKPVENFGLPDDLLPYATLYEVPR